MKAALHFRRSLFILPVYFELFFFHGNPCQRYITESAALLGENRVIMTEFIRNLVTRTEFMWAPSNGLQHIPGERGIVGEKSSFLINADLSPHFLERSHRPHTYAHPCSTCSKQGYWSNEHRTPAIARRWRVTKTQGTRSFCVHLPPPRGYRLTTRMAMFEL
jgi:hypothetical protein